MCWTQIATYRVYVCPPCDFQSSNVQGGGLLEVLYGNIMLVIFDHTFYITSTYIPQSLVIQHSHLLIHQQS